MKFDPVSAQTIVLIVLAVAGGGWAGHRNGQEKGLNVWRITAQGFETRVKQVEDDLAVVTKKNAELVGEIRVLKELPLEKFATAYEKMAETNDHMVKAQQEILHLIGKVVNNETVQ